MDTLRLITSRANPAFKSLTALTSDPRISRREGRALADGIHIVEACFAHGITVQQLLVSQNGQHNPQIQALLACASDVPCLLLSDALFREISGVATPTGIAAVISIPPVPQGMIAGDVVLLDGIQDVGNVGTILRTASAAGIQDVVLGTGCAGVWTPRVLRAGQGAHFNLRIREQADLAATLRACSGISVATVARGGVSPYALDLRQPIVWLFGNEGAGLSAELIEAAQQRVTIPLAAKSESLNVAAAVAVCLFEAVRQRQ
jgi:TrmH family RNA methyltransferase